MFASQKFQHFICPLDDSPLSLIGKQLNCEHGHSFDLAKQGYINLLSVQHKKSKTPGDSSAMVNARRDFLATGRYEKVIQKALQIIQSLNLSESSTILDAGCGEGYYTQLLAQHFPQAQLIGLDISKQAIKAACKRHSSIDWVVSSNAKVPLQAESVDLIICIFGFPSFSGFSKVLKPGGRILLIDPEQNHLLELRQQVYPQVTKRSAYSVAESQQVQLHLIDQQRLCFITEPLKQRQIQDLLLMTPHLFRTSEQGKQNAKTLDNITLSVDMLFRLLQKKI